VFSISPLEFRHAMNSVFVSCQAGCDERHFMRLPKIWRVPAIQCAGSAQHI